MAQCERSHECGFLFSYDCEGVARDNCPDAVFSTGSLRTIEGTIECAAELQTRSCDDVARYKFPDCVMNGEVADGSPCIYSSQCASGRCTGGPVNCGSCVPQLPSGAECSLADHGGDACPNGETCVDGICQSYARSPDLPSEPGVGVTPVLPGLGAPCTAACSGDLLGVANDEGTERICRTPRTSRQPCYSVLAEPESPKTCHPAGELVCAERSCQPLPSPGMSCLLVDYDYVCDGICTDGGACLARPELGEACLNAGFVTDY